MNLACFVFCSDAHQRWTPPFELSFVGFLVRTNVWPNLYKNGLFGFRRLQRVMSPAQWEGMVAGSRSWQPTSSNMITEPRVSKKCNEAMNSQIPPSTLNDALPPARFHPLKIPWPPHTAPPTGYQVLKHLSPFKSFKSPPFPNAFSKKIYLTVIILPLLNGSTDVPPAMYKIQIKLKHLVSLSFWLLKSRFFGTAIMVLCLCVSTESRNYWNVRFVVTDAHQDFLLKNSNTKGPKTILSQGLFLLSNSFAGVFFLLNVRVVFICPSFKLSNHGSHFPISHNYYVWKSS